MQSRKKETTNGYEQTFLKSRSNNYVMNILLVQCLVHQFMTLYSRPIRNSSVGSFMTLLCHGQLLVEQSCLQYLIVFYPLPFLVIKIKEGKKINIVL